MHSQHVEPTANSLRLLHLHDHFRISLALHFLLVYFCALEYCEGEEKNKWRKKPEFTGRYMRLFCILWLSAFK